MEQFSHDLTLALEETSRVRAGHCWGGRRRTRSTGNLPCAPQPTEDSSSPGDGNIDINECQSNSILSDSDDRQNFQLALKVRQTCLFGNFESDSLNENFSPTRPSTRRKRKFKRMAVEYETTPSTPGNPNPNTMFPLTGSSTVKKRVMKHTNQENFRTGLFFCGKRKRSHRERYHDYDHYRLHSSSVPRQREFFTPKNSYLEYKNRSRNAYAKPCERILPLNKNIVSKIEKISLESLNHSGAMSFAPGIVTANDGKSVPTGFNFDSAYLKCSSQNTTTNTNADVSQQQLPQVPVGLQTVTPFTAKSLSIDSASSANTNKMPQKSGSFDSPFVVQDIQPGGVVQSPMVDISLPIKIKESSRKGHNTSRHSNHKRKQSKRSQLKMQFHEQNGMDCGNLNDFLSSSSLSSSDSEAGETNESDREGDDELTDWPGNEAMVNFASKNDFKRAKSARSSTNNNASGVHQTSGNLKARFTNDDCMGQDEDTLMSADELPTTTYASHLSTSQNPVNTGTTLLNLESSIFPPKFPTSLQNRLTSNDSLTHSSPSTSDNQLTSNSSRVLRTATSLPIDIVPQSYQNFTSGIHTAQIESEMSGEASNPFLASPSMEVREIRAGCRRIRDERPGFTIFSSVNEHLARFLQDSRQSQLILPYTNTEENDKLIDLAKLYSLRIEIENCRAIFYKTINTTQSVKIDQSNMSKLFLSDYKRRCYGAEAGDDSESTEMAS
ncbi:uncharacterized protein LOC129580415 [Sitodiplosis mosellana]|uniref:uncharacterized protein LOC129580415 n=1 Tax=Sitodiplosis mosellana TaxID=263140 RepID=UPI002444CC85|nr:uncharacterized protein LOC129580415 [Sitodiplosis mosellana]XP_055326805.1 uncharacterized protein LOC129580415 [Sitodiplosis mosellana]XP_055326806.1 uncharacterized protein LOC129580415 [Sitodiplosis mosellana]